MHSHIYDIICFLRLYSPVESYCSEPKFNKLRFQEIKVPQVFIRRLTTGCPKKSVHSTFLSISHDPIGVETCATAPNKQVRLT